MNAASQFLRVLAILGAIAAGVLFYMTHGKIDTLQKQAASASSSAAASDKSNSDKIADLTSQLANSTAAADTAQKAAADSAHKVELADSLRQQAEKDAEDAQNQIKDLQSKISTLNSQINDLTIKANGVDELANKLASANQQVAALNDQINQLNQQIIKGPTKSGSSTSSSGGSSAAMAPVDNTPVAPPQLGKASPAKVLQIDTKNWIVVLDVGADNSLQKDAQLYLKIGDQAIGKVIVRNTQSNMATCDVASTDPISSADFAKIVTRGLQVDYQQPL